MKRGALQGKKLEKILPFRILGPAVKSLYLALFLFVGAGLLDAAEIRVMTWDIEDAYPMDKYPVIAKVVREQKVDILALQNVQTKQERIHQTIQRELDKLFGQGVYKHTITTGQRFDANVIFWNTRTVQPIDSPETQALQTRNTGSRPMQIFRAKAKNFEFTIVNVNLYEGLLDEEGPKLDQAAELRDLIRRLQKSAPVILTGNLQMGLPGERVYDEISDTYEDQESPAYAELNPDGFLSFCTKDLMARNPRAFSYVGDVLEGGRLTDHIAATQGAWKRYSQGSAHVVRVDKDHYESLDDYEWNFSEHLPVVANFKKD
jgi:endonuclease/exonuclease/phosphatase family metal-dependent hydrolase